MASATRAKSTPTTHDELLVVMAEVIGVSLLAIFADSSDSFGRVAVAIMAAWFLLFLISNAAWLQSLVGKL